jgi:regulator of sirC expression with transglutaminase-like and TPR domain
MPTQQLDYFKTLVADDEHFPLTEAAISVGQHAYPALDVQHVLDEIDALVLKLKTRITPETTELQKLQALKYFFFQEMSFTLNANDYYDPENSYLHSVITSRRGIPISLALLLIEIGQQIGLQVKGISFPNHFLVRISLPQGEVVMDPTTGSSLSKNELQAMLDPYLDAQGYRGELALPLSLFLRSASPRETLSRFLRNLKAVYSHDDRWERLLSIQERLVILLPEEMEEIRDRGLAYAQLEYFRPAIDDLQMYLERCPEADDVAQIQNKCAELERNFKYQS